MHIADTLLSPAVGTTMCAVSAIANIYAVKKIKKDDLCEKKIHIMGVMSAFVFAAQMVNFTIPATGSSGHIMGGILLAAMLGGFQALLSISAVLIIQCLFFADGGLLALGCNIFNMGIIPCLVVYPLIFEPLVKKGITTRRITAASIVATAISLQLGAFGVVLETQLSGITTLSFSAFLVSMQPIHLAIGFAEGIITAAVLCFVYGMRPEIMESTYSKMAIQSSVHIRKVLITFAIATIFAGGVLSLFASSYPDGLEWAIEKAAMELEAVNPIIEKVTETKGAGNSEIRTSVAGIAGGMLTFLLAGTAAFAISAVKKRKDIALFA
jgi:cobalt/nickel transport system permease protein